MHERWWAEEGKTFCRLELGVLDVKTKEVGTKQEMRRRGRTRTRRRTRKKKQQQQQLQVIRKQTTKTT